MIALVLRFLKPQGIAGLAVSVILASFLTMQWLDAKRWKARSANFEQLYQKEQAAFATTVADYRQAAAAAQSADKANADRVAAAQTGINERTISDFESRIAAARTRAGQLRLPSAAAADPGARAGAPMPGLPVAARRPAEAPGQDRLHDPDQLTATEQAIQLDELIKWVRAQNAVDPNSQP